MQNHSRWVGLVAMLVLMGCGVAPPRFCDASVCPSGCCDPSGSCEGGNLAVACGTNGTTCKSCQIDCVSGFCTEDGVGGGGGTTGTCGSPVVMVNGSLPNAAGTPNLYNGLSAAAVFHKRDVDPVEDGCVATVELTLRSGGQCELKVVAGGKKLANGALVLKSIELNANSQCPGFLDAQEGLYENTGGLTTGELLLSMPTAPGRNVASACLATTMTLKLGGALHRKVDNLPLQMASSQIVISGQFASSGDVALKCPQLCTGGNCLPQQYWEDPVTHLKWEHPAQFALPSKQGSWTAANAYCAALTVGGVAAGTWRMPTIDELRTLIRNNPATEPGGACKVCTACTGSCLAFSCYAACDTSASSSTCFYAPPELGTDCTTPFQQFSSTAVTDKAGKHWSLMFYTGSLHALATEGGVRCVR